MFCKDHAMSSIVPIRGPGYWFFVSFLVSFYLGCGAKGGPPEEFPAVDLGMSREQVREALTAQGGQVTEETERMIAVTGRDVRVAEETFFFFHDRLAAWTVRFAEQSTRRGFTRLAKRFTMAYGGPDEENDDGWVLRARWRLPEGGDQLILSGFVGGRGPETPLTARLEDPSVMPRLLREMRREDMEKIESAEGDSSG